MMRELDDALGMTDLAPTALRDTCHSKNSVHRLGARFRPSVFRRLTDYEDAKDADPLALDPVMRQVVSGRAVDTQAAAASQIGRFKTETLLLTENRTALACNLATFLRCIELTEAMADWSLTKLQLKLIKVGARVLRHARAITLQLAQIEITGPIVRAILAAIRRLRAPPSCV